MIDLHTHSLFSDGELLPMELARRYEDKGYKAVALTDHVDYSNLQNVIRSTVKVAREINSSNMNITVIPGVEITHVPPDKIASMVQEIRGTEIQIIVCHGETIVEPVAKGTNKSAIEAGVDILSHPGLIKEETAKLCVKKGVRLEITSRKGHSLTNGHVVRIGKELGTSFAINTDSHVPGDIVSVSRLKEVGMGAGLTYEEVEKILRSGLEEAEKFSTAK